MAMRDECRGELSIAPKNERLKRASTDMNSATKMRFVIPALALGVLLADNAEELEHLCTRPYLARHEIVTSNGGSCSVGNKSYIERVCSHVCEALGLRYLHCLIQTTWKGYGGSERLDSMSDVPECGLVLRLALSEIQLL